MMAFDVVHRPGQALHQALAGVPRASGGFGEQDPTFDLARDLPAYEQFWRDAARDCVGLEGCVEALRSVPDRHSWLVLGDLADIVAALPALDHGLSASIGPGFEGSEDFAVPYAMLIHPGQGAVRLCTSEIRARVPAHPTSSRGGPPAPPAVLGDGAGKLDRLMVPSSTACSTAAGTCRWGDLRAVTRLLESSGAGAAQVPERAAAAVPGAGDAAGALRQVGLMVARLRGSPVRSISVERLEVLRRSEDLQRRVHALAAQGRQLPSPASPSDLRRLAVPALEFAGRADSDPSAGGRCAGVPGRRAAAGPECRRGAQHLGPALGHRPHAKRVGQC